MSKFKGTKGEWYKHGTDGVKCKKVPGLLATAWSVFSLPDIEIRKEGESWLAMRLRIEPQLEKFKEEREANAKLIAAAPDLLEACEEALRMYDEVNPVGGWQGVRNELVHAIKKATE